MQEPSKSSKVVRVLGIAGVVGALGAGVAVYAATNGNDDQAASTTSATATPTAASSASPSASSDASASSSSTSSYKDGTYTETGTYRTPGGQETIGVKITLTGGVITDAEVTSQAERAESKRYQAMFIAGYKSLVVGKAIDEVSLDRVSGSSLTPQGFDDALEQVKSDAKA